MEAMAKSAEVSVEQLLRVMIKQFFPPRPTEEDAAAASGRAMPPLLFGSSTPRGEGLSTDGLDPDEDSYWRELRDLTQDEGERAEAKPGSAPAR